MAKRVDDESVFKGEDLTGRKFGKLTVVRFYKGVRAKSGERQKLWFCKCECGADKIVWGVELKTGHTSSCGKHPGNLRHGLTKHPIHKAFCKAKGRCRDSNNWAWKYYGGRGIKFLFNSFGEFWEHLSPTWSQGLTLDRIDVNGHYEPGNLRWATRAQQSDNTSRTKRYAFNGKLMTLSEIHKLNPFMSYPTFRLRIIMMGWPIEKALSFPVRKYSHSAFSTASATLAK